ncbi:hypothetical protein C8A00DRAFT_43113 [Chaetomidium leptoderma]|uniref:Tyrosinase copper-binding domain-containing protein n=1 Tax=Chaetomidium leptoderma TaxID=669021 RepID=A0AAN6ZXR4_9PEZI|nr:hypothetical protein C8A00DRAFT_43113 [Chaetomidium leptoderma]
MQLPSLSVGLLFLACLPTAALAAENDDAEVAASERIAVLAAMYKGYTMKTMMDRHLNTQVRERRDWGRFSTEEKEAFIDAVHCLNSMPGETPRDRAPGARTRYDDFIVAHIEQTPFVHSSGLFLPFHRYFLHLFDQDIREKCGYKGPFPFWDWTRSYKDPREAAVFDGSPYSLGGNGAYVAGRVGTNITLPNGTIKTIPPATGGGCVESGPFTPDKFELRLGPVGYEPQGPDGGLGYNPRCLTRDLSPVFSRDTSPSRVVALLDQCWDLACVNEHMDAPGGVPGGVHAAGHWQVGLNALDVYASPSDPIFWLHHAQVDRIWTIWQGLDPGRRHEQAIRDLISAIDGEFYYWYPDH